MRLIRTSEFVIQIANDEKIEVFSTQLAIIENYAYFMQLNPTRELIRFHFKGEFCDAWMDGFKPEQYNNIEDCMLGFELKDNCIYDPLNFKSWK